ncbi:hypothetical protein CEXT_722291 [Caerostris extrusa]|uniref:Uncharacterized protein n=1 Tax=Caerostris extrusa TaxID=172846 RepID=A0AAV4VJD4_CAEEX|nr:hypothetical protein CEXT_722291 [Caerostris extrusa]
MLANYFKTKKVFWCISKSFCGESLLSCEDDCFFRIDAKVSCHSHLQVFEGLGSLLLFKEEYLGNFGNLYKMRDGHFTFPQFLCRLGSDHPKP